MKRKQDYKFCPVCGDRLVRTSYVVKCNPYTGLELLEEHNLSCRILRAHFDIAWYAKTQYCKPWWRRLLYRISQWFEFKHYKR